MDAVTETEEVTLPDVEGEADRVAIADCDDEVKPETVTESLVLADTESVAETVADTVFVAETVVDWEYEGVTDTDAELDAVRRLKPFHLLTMRPTQMTRQTLMEWLTLRDLWTLMWMRNSTQISKMILIETLTG